MADNGIPYYDRESRKLADELEESYAATVTGATVVRWYLKRRTGNAYEILDRFYTPFGVLYDYTHSLPLMRDINKTLHLEIYDWLNYPKKMNPQDEREVLRYFRLGLELFEDYQYYLLEKGVIKSR